MGLRIPKLSHFDEVAALTKELEQLKATVQAPFNEACEALANCGIAGIMDEFRDPADAIRQMAEHIRILGQVR